MRSARSRSSSIRIAGEVGRALCELSGLVPALALAPCSALYRAASVEKIGLCRTQRGSSLTLGKISHRTVIPSNFEEYLASLYMSSLFIGRAFLSPRSENGGFFARD
jgi:hypothetical protein